MESEQYLRKKLLGAVVKNFLYSGNFVSYTFYLQGGSYYSGNNFQMLHRLPKQIVNRNIL